MTNPHDQINPISENTLSGYGGLTKREYFCGIALQGILANPVAVKAVCDKYDENKRASVFAKDAIECADALIEELNK